MLHGELSGRNFPKTRMDKGSVSFTRRSSDENWEVGNQGRKLEAGRSTAGRWLTGWLKNVKITKRLLID